MKFLKKIDKTEIMGKVTRAASKCGYKLKKASPTIMIVGAAIGGVTATVLACKATIKAQDIMTEHYAQVESIHTAKKQIEDGTVQLSEGETYTEKDYKSDITTTYVQTGLKLAKVYAPAVTLGAVSLGCMFGSHHIMSKRNASLTAAYIALDKAFEEYKSRVSDRFGSRVQEELEHNIKAVELESKSTNEQGVEETIKEYKDITTLCFQNVTPEEQNRVYGLFGDKDPVVHTFDLFHEHYPQAIRFHGEHRLIDKVAFHYLAPVIRWINDKQNGKERPIVYIDFDALHDSYWKATSSMHKAYEMLIEYYNVYIVAQAPTNDHDYMARVMTWVEEYLSAPAYNHVIFCNQKALLYGDYFIDPCPDKGFMGTAIEYGSDEFKTFEEIITFFERLGGQ